MANGAFGEDRDVGGTATDVHQAHAQFFLVIGQHGIRRGQLLENDVVDLQTAATYALFDVLRRVHRTGHHVDLGFQTYAGHAQRLTHAFLIIDHVILRQGVQHTLVGRNGHCLSSIEHTLQVRGADFAITNRHDAVRVQAANVAACNANECRVDTAASHQLRFFDCALDRLHGRFDIHHHALLQAAGGMGTDTHDFQRAIGRDFAYQCHHLGGTDIQPDDHFAALHICHGPASYQFFATAGFSVAGAACSRQPTARPLE